MKAQCLKNLTRGSRHAAETLSSQNLFGVPPNHSSSQLTVPLPNFDVLSSVQRQTLQTVTRYSYGPSSFCCSRNCYAKHRGTSPSYIYANYTSSVALRRPHFYRCIQKTKSMIFTNLLTDRTQTYSLPRRSRQMVILLGHSR